VLAVAPAGAWPAEPVEGAALIQELTNAIKRYVVMEDGAAEAVALWVIHAHALDAFVISPRLAITSPEKGCGKTSLLDVIGHLVSRPLPTSNATPAALFRSIEAVCPTLLIDEGDTFLHAKDDLRGILNSGHRRSSAFVTRVVGDDFEPCTAWTWESMIVIGEAPAAEDRCAISDPAALHAISCINSLRLTGFTPWPRTTYVKILLRS
jgi:putative DNA primase/helicase